jgi:hypothetical protein
MISLSENEIVALMDLAEHCRDRARIELFTDHPINLAVAEYYVNQSNLIRKILCGLNIPNVGPEWTIKNRRVVQIIVE